MAFLKLLLSLGIIIVVTALPIGYENWRKNLSTATDYHLSDNIKPIDYKIKLILSIEEGLYRGESTVNIKINEETQHIVLHSMYLVTKTTLINKDIRSRKNKKLVYKATGYSYNEKNILIINFADKLIPGNYTLNIEFFGKITNNTEGLFRTSYKNRKGDQVWLIATHLQASGARQLFPCWDKPELKAKFIISVKHPIKYIALSNMPVQNQQKVENDMIWTHFKATPPMSPYLVAIAVIDFISVSRNKKIKLWHREKITHAKYTYLFTYYFTTTLEDEWYMITMKMTPKVDYVAIPDFPEKAVVTWGLVLYRETDVINEELSLLNMTHDALKTVRLIAHSVAQESVNNMMPWLNEGLTRFLETFVIDKNFPAYRMMDMLVVQDQHESFRLNSYFNENLLHNYIDLSEINSLPSSLRYHKASSILRMLQHLLTNEVFRNGIQRYLFETPFWMMIPEAFWTTMQNALDEWDNKHECNLTEKMDGWTKHKNYPILKVTHYSAGYANISLENFDSIDSDKYDFWIPITYTTQNNFDFNKTSLRNVVWLKSTWQNLSIDVSSFKEDDWIIINLQQAGYYRVNYDTENWNKIAKYLNSMEYENIHVLNRAQIIDDAFYFLTTSQIDSSVFWELTNYLSREKDYVAWYPMIKALEHMSSVFPLSDRRVYNIKKKMQKIFNGLLQNMGYEESNETYLINCLRQEVTKWACILDEPNCKKAAASKLQEHLANRTTNKFLPWWEEWTYCNGLAMSGDSIWNNVFNVHIEKSDNKYLKFLACSENIAIIKNYMMLMASENHNEKIKDKDRVNSFHFIVAKHAKNSIMLDFILSNFENVAPRQASTAAVLIDIINHVYSQELLQKIQQFVISFLKQMNLDVERKIKTRLSEIESQMNYLQKLSNFDEINRIN